MIQSEVYGLRLVQASFLFPSSVRQPRLTIASNSVYPRLSYEALEYFLGNLVTEGEKLPRFLAVGRQIGKKLPLSSSH